MPSYVLLAGHHMSDTYAKYAAVCTKFYELTADADNVSRFAFSGANCKPGQRTLFVGSMFHVARSLAALGLDLSVVDYSNEMVEIGSLALPPTPVCKADLRKLPFESQFDAIFVIGRVFSHMVDDADVAGALESCRRAGKKGARLFFDSYETSRIQHTGYFNGETKCSDSDTEILRRSSTTKLSDNPGPWALPIQCPRGDIATCGVTMLRPQFSALSSPHQ